MSDAKTKLIEATIHSLMKQGVEGCSVRKICDQAGLSIGLVNYHFDSFDHLIAESYSHIALQFLGQAREACQEHEGRPRQQLSAFIRDIFGPEVMKHNVLRAWIVFWGLIDSAPPVQAAHEESNAAFSSFLEDLFIKLNEESNLLISPRLAAIGLTAMIDGLWLEWCLKNDSFSPAECIQLCENWVQGIQK